jgi:hypothetical protein
MLTRCRPCARDDGIGRRDEQLALGRDVPVDYEESWFVRSASAAIEAAKIHALCFDDRNVPHGLSTC